MIPIDPKKIRGVVVEVECYRCEGKKVVPGGQRKYDELTDCSFCGGHGFQRSSISLAQLVSILRSMGMAANGPIVVDAGPPAPSMRPPRDALEASRRIQTIEVKK